MRILVVDDHHDARRSLRLALEVLGHQVMQAATGDQALYTMRTEAVDVVLLDLDLGQDSISGWDVLREKMQDERIFKIHVIITTGLSAAAIRKHDEAPDPLAGAHFILSKPVSLETLREHLAFIEKYGSPAA